MVLPYISRIFCENTVFHIIVTSKAFKAFQGRIKCKNHKVTLVPWGNFYQTTRISAEVCYKQVSSMALSCFFRNSPPTIVYASLFTAMGIICVCMKTLRNHERMELSWAHNVCNTEFIVEKRLEHGFAI